MISYIWILKIGYNSNTSQLVSDDSDKGKKSEVRNVIATSFYVLVSANADFKFVLIVCLY